MTKRTRYFMVTSGAILVAGLCVGLVAYFGGFAPNRARQTERRDLEYVPAAATLVAYANVRDVMASQLREHLRRIEPDSGERQRFQDEIGIDLETDIDHVVACLIPGEGEDNDSGFVLLRGRFDDERLEALARDHGAETEEYHGERLLRLPQGIDRDAAFVLVEPGLALLGDVASVRRALDQRESGRSVTSNDELMTLIREIEREHNAWAVGRLSGLTDRARLPEAVIAQLPAIQRFAVGGRVNGGLSGTIRADARDEEAAQNLRDVLLGFIALAKLQAGARPAWQAVLDSLQLSGAGTTVAISFQIPAEVIELLGPDIQNQAN